MSGTIYLATNKKTGSRIVVYYQSLWEAKRANPGYINWEEYK